MLEPLRAFICAIDAGTTEDEHADSMFFLYFKAMEMIEEAELHEALHPGHGHPRFGVRAENNPLLKLNVCHFYMMIPERFQMLTGFSPSEFFTLLVTVKSKMLRPRNGFCEFSASQQSSRKPSVRTHSSLSSCPFPSPAPTPPPRPSLVKLTSCKSWPQPHIRKLNPE
jgi:hypothetical protein